MLLGNNSMPLQGKCFAEWIGKSLRHDYCFCISGQGSSRRTIWQGQLMCRAGIWIFIQSAKDDCGEVARLSDFWLSTVLIRLQTLTESVRPSNTLHLLHNNTDSLHNVWAPRWQQKVPFPWQSLNAFICGCLCRCLGMWVSVCISECLSDTD